MHNSAISAGHAGRPDNLQSAASTSVAICMTLHKSSIMIEWLSTNLSHIVQEPANSAQVVGLDGHLLLLLASIHFQITRTGLCSS